MNTRFTKITMPIMAVMMLILSLTGSQVSAYANPLHNPGPTTCPTGQFLAQYYNHISPDANLALTRCEGEINHDWGTGSPGDGVNHYSFSARWLGRFDFDGGDYTFVARADDGVRLWVDENLLIDAWKDQVPTEYRANVELNSGAHEVKMEYYERRGEAVAQLSWGDRDCPTGQYLAQYYDNNILQGTPVYTACEENLNHSWGVGGPGYGMKPDNFSARWLGRFAFSGGDYTFVARADDGLRLWVDEKLLIDAWKDQPPTEYRAGVKLNSGEHEVKVEYYERSVEAVAYLWWGSTPCPTGQYLAQYYNNGVLQGDPVLTRCETAINYDWGQNDPGNGVHKDNFSARWLGRFAFVGGDYTFIARADDGLRLWVDENLLIDAWKAQATTEYEAKVTLSGGEHEVKVQYFENIGEAVTQVAWEPPCSAGQFFAEYYNNRTLSGAPAFTRCESGEEIDHNWGASRPGSAVGVDNFSARWTGRLNLSGGNYTFIAQADDGIQLWVDEKLLIDAWQDQPVTEYRANVTLSSGQHQIKVQYYEHTGQAVVKVWREPFPCPTGQFLAQYYNNTSLRGDPVFTRCEGAVNYSWGTGGPGNGVKNDNLSVRWQGRFNFSSGSYTFIARADDGVRLWVDDSLLIDAWQDQPATEYRANATLSSGVHEVRMEYYEHGGDAVAQIAWHK